jgi:hypothetical protein
MESAAGRTEERNAERRRLRRIAARVMVIQVVTLLALLWMQMTFGR